MQHGCEPAAKPKHQTSMCYMAPCTTEEWHNVLDAFEPRGVQEERWLLDIEARP